MKIAILSNDVLPGMGLPASGQGIRADTTHKLLTEQGHSVDILLDVALVETRYDRWPSFPFVAVPDHVSLFQTSQLRERLTPYDAVVVHNWAAARDLCEGAGTCPLVIYDFFSATLLEHQYFNRGPNYLSGILGRKRDIVRRAAGIWANGPGRVRYARDFLARHGLPANEVVNVPMCPPRADNARQPLIVVGGFQQAWTTPLSADTYRAIACALPQHRIVRLSRGVQYHGIRLGKEAGGANALAAGDDGVIDLMPMTVDAYRRLMAQASVFVDLSGLNDERRLSFSSRGLTALACGCPIVHNKETDLGALIDTYDAGCTIAEADVHNERAIVTGIMACIEADKRDNTVAMLKDLERQAAENVAAFFSALQEERRDA